MRSLFVCASLIVVSAGLTFAMGIRTERQLLARGADGAALYEVRELGPEGGGALSYRIEVGKLKNGRPRQVSDFKLSSDFSPGGSERPQTVSAAVCAERLAALHASLNQHRFAGVSLHPERCQQEERDNLVVVANPPAR